MSPSYPLAIARFDPAQGKDCLEWTYNIRSSWVISMMEIQKAAEYSQTTENINDPRGFIVLQTLLALFPSFRNK